MRAGPYPPNAIFLETANRIIWKAVLVHAARAGRAQELSDERVGGRRAPEDQVIVQPARCGVNRAAFFPDTLRR
jgi:hypothetical protein